MSVIIEINCTLYSSLNIRQDNLAWNKIDMSSLFFQRKNLFLVPIKSYGKICVTARYNLCTDRQNFDRFWVESLSAANLNEVFYAPIKLITNGKSSIRDWKQEYFRISNNFIENRSDEIRINENKWNQLLSLVREEKWKCLKNEDCCI